MQPGDVCSHATARLVHVDLRDSETISVDFKNVGRCPVTRYARTRQRQLFAVIAEAGESWHCELTFEPSGYSRGPSPWPYCRDTKKGRCIPR